MNSHKFWSNEPIINFNDLNVKFNEDNCPIQIKNIESIKKIPYDLPFINETNSLLWYQFNFNIFSFELLVASFGNVFFVFFTILS